MLFLTKYFGVTDSDAERSRIGEQAVTEEIGERVLVMQSEAAAQQHRPLRRGTHAKRICARAQFEVCDGTVGRDRGLAEQLAERIFERPGVCTAVVSAANSDS